MWMWGLIVFAAASVIFVLFFGASIMNFVCIFVVALRILCFFYFEAKCGVFKGFSALFYGYIANFSSLAPSALASISTFFLWGHALENMYS